MNSSLGSIIHDRLSRFARRGGAWSTPVLAACLLVLVAWTARADQLYATINGADGFPGGHVFQYNPSGKQSTFISGTEAAFGGALLQPRGLAFDKSNNFYVACNAVARQGTVFKVTPGGKISTFATGFPQGFFLEGIVTDRGGNVYVVAVNFNDPVLASTIFRITPHGSISTFGSIPGETFDLAFDSAGNLFAADMADQTIFKFTPAGARSVFAGPASFGAGRTPVGLAFDKAGNLFVSTSGNFPNDAILKFTPAGAVSTFATGLSHSPRGLAIASNGDLLVAETGFGTPGDILKISRAGVITVFAAGIGDPNASFTPGAEFLTFKESREECDR